MLVGFALSMSTPMSLSMSMPIPWQAIVVCTKKAPFGKTFCLGRTGPGFVYNFMNGRAMGAVGLDPVSVGQTSS